MANRETEHDDDVIFDNNFSDSEEDLELDSPPFQTTREELSSAKKPNASFSFDRLPPSHKSDRQRRKNNSNVSDGLDVGVQNPASLGKISYQNENGRDEERYPIESLKELGFQQNHNGGDVESLLSSGWQLLDDDLKCFPLVPASQKDRSDSVKNNERNTYKTSKHSGFRSSKRKGSCARSSRIKRSSLMGMFTKLTKASGFDVASLMKTAEHTFGPKMNMRLPCMQCFEKPGGSGDFSGLGPFMESLGGTGSSSGGNRCSKCGGQVHTFASFGKMISQMRTVMVEKGLIPHDVYPDGNCAFAAVVDQLRIRGDFGFTIHTLRDAAVQYLRENPHADDGTPLDMFLANNETWETYLTRMSEDGEWGDHLVLMALTNVTCMPITIYGGMSGERETVIEPKIATSADTDNKTRTDTGAIFLGHVGESHYMSLRPKMWKQTLYNAMKENTFNENRFDARCPVQRIDFLLRQVIRMRCIESRDSSFVQRCVPSDYEENGFRITLVGSIMCMMTPSKASRRWSFPDITLFFPAAKPTEDLPSLGDTVVLVLKTPLDTRIFTSFADAKAIDLVAENKTCCNGQLRLIPKNPRSWSGKTVAAAGGKVFLKSTGDCLNLGNVKEKFLARYKECRIVFHSLLAFQCPWPMDAAEWQYRHRPASFPDEKTIQMIVNEGCHLVPYTTEKMLDDILDHPVFYRKLTDNHSWSYTFAAAEKQISRFLSIEQRQCFLLFTFWVGRTLNESNIPHSILKSIFFCACENIDKQTWKSRPGECLLVLLKKLLISLQRKCVPQYFMITINLLEGIPEEDIDRWFEQLNVTRIQPVVTLYFILDQLEVLSSDLGGFVEDIIEDMIKDHCGRSETGEFHESLTPACSTSLSELIYQEDYPNAMCLLQDLTEENKHSRNTEDETYFATLKKSCWKMHIGFKWCFALYVDIRLKTRLTMELCAGSESVHITEVFGPKCMEEFPNTLVPDIFKLSNGDLLFAKKVSNVLSQCVSGQSYIKAFKFYLKTYAEIAGDEVVIPYQPDSGLISCTGVSSVFPKHLVDAMPQMLRAISRPGMLSMLHDVYVNLFNTCEQCKQVEEFREMMPAITKIVEELKTPTSYATLKHMWAKLGDLNKSEEIKIPSGTRRLDEFIDHYELD